VPRDMLAVAEIMAILPATVPRLVDLTDGLTRRQLHAPPGPESWSVNDVLAHLRACNDILGGAALRIIDEDHPSWRAMNPRTWQRKSGYQDLEFRESFDAFTVGRAELLAVLTTLPDDAWERTAAVTVPPRQVYERNVRYYGDWLAEHERTHIRSLPAIIARVG
jgi:hypothetical protein